MSVNELITNDDIQEFQRIGSQELSDNPTIVVKLFLPGSRWTWYLTEYDLDNKIGFGYVESGIDDNYDERGSVSIEELASLPAYPLAPNGVERDVSFTQDTFKSLIKQ